MRCIYSDTGERFMLTGNKPYSLMYVYSRYRQLGWMRELRHEIPTVVSVFVSSYQEITDIKTYLSGVYDKIEDFGEDREKTEPIVIDPNDPSINMAEVYSVLCKFRMEIHTKVPEIVISRLKSCQGTKIIYEYRPKHFIVA